MDSHPEKDFFERILDALNENPDDVEDIYFMGAITDQRKRISYLNILIKWKIQKLHSRLFNTKEKWQNFNSRDKRRSFQGRNERNGYQKIGKS